MTERPPRILPAIIVSQFAGSSVWFAANAVLPDLPAEWRVSVGPLTSAVQLGFIVGTLLIAITGLADRFSPRIIFALSALGAGLTTLGLFAGELGPGVLIGSRLGTGLCLAGIYPIGMKIATGWYRQGLGTSLGWLVGALVVGTAFPHLLRALGAGLPWQAVVGGSAALAATGGALMFTLVPDGPHLRVAGRFDPTMLRALVGLRSFRAAALGYFGHMWELYTVWALIPAIIIAHDPALATSLWAFSIIAIGAVGCVVGGLLAPRFGSARVAIVQLAISGFCCLAFPWMLGAPTWLFTAYLLIWGVAVVGDSPQFSTLTAQAAPPQLIGSGLTLVTSVGFTLTIISLLVADAIGSLTVLVPTLALGPVLGLVAMRSQWHR